MGSEMICNHAHKCEQAADVYSRPGYCSAKHSHRFDHEHCGGMHCPHASGAWVECISLTVRNPALPVGL